MRILVDTQCFLWSFLAPDRLSSNAQRILSGGHDELFFSAASSWEIAIKVGIGKLHLPDTPDIYVLSRLTNAGIMGVPVTHIHALRVYNLPPLHKDPFDRLLVVQAELDSLTILTPDPLIVQYGVSTLW
ncbi:MAG: type II toxin-antitoxin system VapC family toxin [Pyrinomonadaceae bacterium]